MEQISRTILYLSPLSCSESISNGHAADWMGFVFGSSFLRVGMPDFIMYNPIRMNTIAPTIGGIQPCQEKYIPVEESIANTAYQIIQNRVIEDIPRISRPTQKTAVFSPSNIFNHLQMCFGKLLNLATIPRCTD